MSPADLTAQIARSAAWWRDHGPEVRESSAAAEREHNGRRIWDHEYRGKVLLEEKLTRAAIRHLGLNKTEKKADPYRGRPAPEVGAELYFSPSGRIIPIGDAYEGTAPAAVGESVASTIRDYERRAAEAEFAAHAEAETGMQMSESEYKKKKRADSLVRTQTAEIASRLEAAGVQALRTDGFKMFVRWIHSRTLEELPSYRRICLLPYIAAMTRAPKLAALEYFLQGNPYARFWTFTTGPRCYVEDIPDRIDWLFTKLRALNKWLAGWDVEIVFRTTEFGTLEGDAAGNRSAEESWGELSRDVDGRVLYHPHAHCVIVNKKGFIRPEKWSAMIKGIHEFWRNEAGEKVMWLADGVIRNPREVCKYVVKPGDVLKLSNAELRAFYEATANRRLVRPMGVLAEEIRDRKAANRSLRRKRVGSRLVWAEVLNHNRINLETEAEKTERHAREDAVEFVEECEAAARCAAPSYPGALDGGIPLKRGVSASITKVMARIGPAAGPTPFKEPRVLVMTNGERPCMREVDTHPLVYRLWSQTVEGWEAGRSLAASLIKVHTGTLSGNDLQNDFGEFYPPPPPDPFLAPFLASTV